MVRMKILINSSLVLASLMITLLGLEFGVRTFGDNDFGLNISEDRLWGHWTHGAHWRIGREQYNRLFVFDNEIGYRREKISHSTEFGPGNMRPIKVLFLGDSVTQWSNYVVAAAKQFHDKHPNVAIEFINAATMGYDTRWEYFFFKKFHNTIKPDVVYLQFCLNDFNTTPVIIGEEGEPWMAFNAGKLTPLVSQFLLNNSDLYKFIFLTLLMLSTDQDFEKNAAMVQSNLRKIYKLVKSHGYEFRFLIFPYFKEEEDPRLQKVLKISRRVLPEGVTINLEPFFKQQEKSAMSMDGTHLTMLGGLKAAKAISSTLEQDILRRL